MRHVVAEQRQFIISYVKQRDVFPSAAQPIR